MLAKLLQSSMLKDRAVAARYLNLDYCLILQTTKAQVDEDPGLAGNLLIEQTVGANIELISKEEYARIRSITFCNVLKERLLKEGRRPSVIPVDGSNSLGTWSYIEAIKDREKQHGSGGIATGRNACLNSCDIVSIANARDLGYAMSKIEELKCVFELAEATGIVLDLVHYRKAAFQMLQGMVENPSKWEERSVPLIHSGGLLGIFDKFQWLQPIIGSGLRKTIIHWYDGIVVDNGVQITNITTQSSDLQD